MLEEMSTERKLLPANKYTKSPNFKSSASDFTGNNSVQLKPDRANGNYRFTRDVASKVNYKTRVANERDKKGVSLPFFQSRDNGRNGQREASQGQEITGGSEVQNHSADIGSVFRPGSKKGSLHELVNFNYNSRNLRRYNYGHSNVQIEEKALRRFTTPTHYNKEQFLLANCQFIINNKFDYTAHLADPDLLVDWDSIEEVRLLEPETPSCPICLYPPVASQITRCGHVFCYPCILHYLALSDKQWRKCPICYESVYKNQLRSVLTSKAGLYTDGQEIIFRLMRREKGSNIVVPASNWEKSRATMKLTDKFARFSKLLLTTANETINSTIQREKLELECRLQEEKDEPESCFISEAINALDKRNRVLIEQITVATNAKSIIDEKASVKDCTHSSSVPSETVTETFIDAFNDVSTSVVTKSRHMDAIAPTEKEENMKASDEHIEGATFREIHQKNSQEIPEKTYFFYQSDDGQPIFMHPLNVHCLIREYGSLEKAPNLIGGSVVEVDTFTMCSETRKRYRYLGHLPLTSVFSLVEFKFQENGNLVSQETLSQFADEFEKRTKFRIQKQQNEKRQQQRCQLWERAILHNTSGLSLASYSAQDAEDFPISTFVQSAQSQIDASLQMMTSSIDNLNSSNFPDYTSGPSASNSDQGTIVGSFEEHGLSFAQMLKCGKPKSTPKIIQNQQNSASYCPEIDEYAPTALTAYRNEIGDALKLALENIDVKEGDYNNTQKNEKQATTSGKKKKKKGKILFSL